MGCSASQIGHGQLLAFFHVKHVHPENLSLLSELVDDLLEDEKALKRVTHILTSSDRVVEPGEAYTSFLRCHPGWLDAKLLMPQHGPIMRFTDEPGHMNACLVLHSYLLDDQGTLDLTRWIHDLAPPSFLCAFAFSEWNSNPFAFLRAGGMTGGMLPPEAPLPGGPRFVHPMEMTLDTLDNPALVIRMRLHDDFLDLSRTTFRGFDTSRKRDVYLTLVLVGLRETPHGLMCLLQDTCRDRPFVEASATYLSSCGASILLFERFELPTCLRPYMIRGRGIESVDCGGVPPL